MTFRIALRHFLVDYAASRGHPLHITRSNDAFIAHAVAVLDVAGKYIGNGFNTPMGVPRKTFEKIAGLLGAKIIKQKKWIEQGNFTISKGPMKMYSSAFESRFTLDDFSDFSVLCHWFSPILFLKLRFSLRS
jgi:hypothetical protein